MSEPLGKIFRSYVAANPYTEQLRQAKPIQAKEAFHNNRQEIFEEVSNGGIYLVRLRGVELYLLPPRLASELCTRWKIEKLEIRTADFSKHENNYLEKMKQIKHSKAIGLIYKGNVLQGVLAEKNSLERISEKIAALDTHTSFDYPMLLKAAAAAGYNVRIVIDEDKKTAELTLTLPGQETSPKIELKEEPTAPPSGPAQNPSSP
ncbi:MAG: hypothetical protein IT558_02370 [Alphaproteobacteria bacterium]|nr:hypothetical protein [Alphaproteobacteria bacterium]